MAELRIAPVDEGLMDLLNKIFTKHYRGGYMNADGCILPKHFAKFADAIDNFEVRDNDVWLFGFPKTGTTWTQEMVWSILNDLDFEAGRVPLIERFPFFEATCTLEKMESTECDGTGTRASNLLADSVNHIANMPSPRFIKTHLPPNLLPRQLRNGEKKPKVVYVSRNPKDTVISYYHYVKLASGYEGSFDELCTLFLGGAVIFGPFWNNVLGYWNKRNEFNMLFIKYEEMKNDLPSVIRKTAKFFGKDLPEDRVRLLTEHLSFSSMKKNPAVNQEQTIKQIQELLHDDTTIKGEFMRVGTTEQWKTAMTPELIKRFDDWISRHFDGTGFSF